MEGAAAGLLTPPATVRLSSRRGGRVSLADVAELAQDVERTLVDHAAGHDPARLESGQAREEVVEQRVRALRLERSEVGLFRGIARQVVEPRLALPAHPVLRVQIGRAHV